jgi:ribonuclease G
LSSEIVINSTPVETRVALIENGALIELYIERKKEKGIVGNVYKGKVTKVLPGMQVAFVDIGAEKAGFLYVSDIDRSLNDDYGKLIASEITGDPINEEGEMAGTPVETPVAVPPHPEDVPIEDILYEGQDLTVQVSKDPIGTKGARITTYITLPGRYLVYMPTINHVAVSRRIEDEAEKKRLKQLILGMKAHQSGYIIRTAAEGKSPTDLESDMDFLNKIWQDVFEKSQRVSSPATLYEDLDIILRSIRDLFTKNVERLVVDNCQEYQKCCEFVASYLPELAGRIELYEETEPIFDHYGLEIEIERAMGRKIWLKSGGYIVIDQTEALVAIDVNTGKFVGKRNQEETILKTNLEAVKEIVYQLRLRNIGGIIIIDFIDMEKEESKEKVFSALEQALKGDRSTTNIVKLSELGLVEMTRKRVRDSLSSILSETCPYCEGRGRIKSGTTVCYEILREIKRVAGKTPQCKKILLNVPTTVADLLFDEENFLIDSLEKELNLQLIVKADYDLHQEQYEINAV